MPNVKLVQGKGQYQNQNAYRTINMAFLPYFPETQRYKMQLDTQFGGNRGGYFSVMPQSAPGGEKMPKLPWKIRMDSYDAKGPSGPLSRLNTYSRKEMAVKSAQNDLDLQLRGSEMANMLTGLIDGQRNRAARMADINNANELELAMIGREIENFLDTGVSSPIRPASEHREGALSPQSLDLHFEENLGLAAGMESITGDGTVGRSIGIEVTTDRDKRLARVTTALGQKASAETAFSNHAHTEIETLNTEIKQRLKQKAVKQDRRGTIPLGPDATDDQRLLETARSKFHMGSIGTIDSFGRRLLSRQSEVFQYNIANDLTKDSFMEQVNLGNDFQGIATIRGYIEDMEGSPVPQFEVVSAVVVEGSSLVEAIKLQTMENLDEANKKIFKLATEGFHIKAIDDAYRISGREELLGTIQENSYAMDNIYGLSLYVGEGSGKGVAGLTTPEVANHIKVQIENLFNNKATQQSFAEFYERMMQRSNKLTDQWKKAVPDGKKHGASIAEEWTYGDLKGNPHKKYLGIWGPAGEDAYEAGGNVGHNVSISPFLSSRREGTVRFK